MDKTNVNPLISMNEWIMTSKGKTWSLGTNSRLPFAINVILNLSIDKNTKKLACENSHLSLLRCKRQRAGSNGCICRLLKKEHKLNKERPILFLWEQYRQFPVGKQVLSPVTVCISLYAIIWIYFRIKGLENDF